MWFIRVFENTENELDARGSLVKQVQCLSSERPQGRSWHSTPDDQDQAQRWSKLTPVAGTRPTQHLV